MKITAFGLTDRGQLRERNEDTLLVNDTHQVYAVADGLGGLPEGSLASQLAINRLEKALEDPKFSENLDYPKLFNSISDAVHVEGKKVSKEIGIGTTLTVLKFDGNEFSIGHVGDSMIFLVRDRSCSQVTTDHTMAVEMRARLEPGEDTYIPEYFSHTLTRCIGQPGIIETDVYTLKPAAGDRLLIGSDGLTKTMSDEDILNDTVAAKNPKTLVEDFIAKANERGAPDNVTVIAIFVE
jgi:protein phosphatase